MPISQFIYLPFTAYCQSPMEMGYYEKNSITKRNGKESSLGAEPDNVEVIEIQQHNFYNSFWMHNSSRVCHGFASINVLGLQCFHRRGLIYYCLCSNSWSLSQEAKWQIQALLTTSASCTRQAVCILTLALSQVLDKWFISSGIPVKRGLIKVHYFLTEKVNIKQVNKALKVLNLSISNETFYCIRTDQHWHVSPFSRTQNHVKKITGVLPGSLLPEPKVNKNLPQSRLTLLVTLPGQKSQTCSEFSVKSLLPFAYVRLVFYIIMEKTAAQGPMLTFLSKEEICPKDGL